MTAQEDSTLRHVIIFLKYGKHRKELSGGFKRTTNNRMELMAAIVGF